MLSATELAAPAFVEAALRGSVGFELRAGDRQVAVQEVDREDPNLWLALAEVESEEGEPEIFPVDAPRVVGIVDRGPAETRDTIKRRPAVSTGSPPARTRACSPWPRAFRGRGGCSYRERSASSTAGSR